MRAAIYARVSTERQEREQTVESQLALLKAWVADHGHALTDDRIYVDEGYSGSRLDRPGLDRLRDEVRDGAVELIVVLSPDRLARKYAYQVLLLEELRRAGCEVVFLHRPISDDPNDQLLLQIQGAIAEYERALIGERFRRGKLQKARSGQYLASTAPYGYRYIPKREGVAGHLVIDETEADLVRTVYRWLVEERMTIRQILKRLNFGPWYPRSGKHPWSSAVVQHILADPIYTGTAYANRYRYVPAKKPRHPAGPRALENACRQLRPKDEWVPIPVPAIIDQSTYERAQAQLARNATLSFRHNTKYSYLLRCLLTCGTCGLAMYGVTYKATTSQAERRYYECHGKDCILSARPEACKRRAVKAEELETTVWDHVVALLNDPTRLLAQFQAFATAAIEGDRGEQAAVRQIEARLGRTDREEKRLIDAYQAEVITLAELRERRGLLETRRRELSEQRAQQIHLRQEHARAQEVLSNLTAFCERIGSRLHEVTFAEKQEILQLLIERIIVGEDTLEIRHVIPLRDGSGPDQPGPFDPGLRSDGLVLALLAPAADAQGVPGSAPVAAAQTAWTELFPVGTPPDPRTDSSAAYDAGSNTMVLFGGNDTGCTFSPSLNDTWLLTNADGLGASASQWARVFPTGTLPGGRRGQTAVYDPATDRMIVFGGDPVGCAVNKYNDTWLLLNATGTHGAQSWAQLATTGGPPPARSDHSAIYDAVNNRMTIAGGFGPAGNLNDVWVLTNANGLGGTPRWVQLFPTGGPPSATGYRAVTYDARSNRMTVFGGWNCCTSPYFNETWVLTHANGEGTPQWIQLAPSGTAPSPRFGASAVYDAPTNTMTIFGGNTSSGQVNDSWTLTNADGLRGTPSWSQLPPSGNLPAPRGGSVANPTKVYDAGYGRMIIFGGGTPNGLVNDTWVLSGLGTPGLH
jgi:site-specific DNA recombinase